MVKIVLTKKLFYSIIILFGILCLSIGVYAFGGNNPSVMGHSMGELAPPSGSGIVMFSSGSWINTANLPPTCTGDTDTLKYNSATRIWTCGTVGFSCNWDGWNPDFISYASLTEDCYYIDTCSDKPDCSTELCPYHLDGYQAVPPPEWDVYATPVLQTECIGGEVSQLRYASVCPTDATSACGYIEQAY